MGQSNGTSTQNDTPAAGAAEKAGRDDLDLTALRQTPGFMIRILQLQIFEDFFAFFAPLGLSPAEQSILMVVQDNPSVTQTEVAGALKIQLPNLVKILAKLEAAGLLKRKRSLRDKRAVELSLTPAGHTTAENAAKQGLAFNAQVLSALTPREQDQFLAMLTRLVATRATIQDRKPD
ncbi:MarR family winged helix-turn-helix transcriptional regulator [Bradyrhizobium prioriisuperbiae]|uniref:MarR family winged helix-turn-helix transcriptional regulator n=1 Tax=Bradyrhizobium prioriisuperbiae TaxID=2854389 RepID=UPI0028EEF4B5|nr:MarR family winged helix-turn-helix transcriptional regulator [Bradyrhizobium prioritasuperba]